MKRLLFGAALFGAAVVAAPAWADMRTPLATAPAEQVGMSKQRLDRIQEVFKKEADENRLPGAVVLVARKGKLVHASATGFQDKDAGKPMALELGVPHLFDDEADRFGWHDGPGRRRQGPTH